MNVKPHSPIAISRSVSNSISMEYHIKITSMINLGFTLRQDRAMQRCDTSGSDGFALRQDAFYNISDFG